jgi:hypothetical protein
MLAVRSAFLCASQYLELVLAQEISRVAINQAGCRLNHNLFNPQHFIDGIPAPANVLDGDSIKVNRGTRFVHREFLRSRVPRWRQVRDHGLKFGENLGKIVAQVVGGVVYGCGETALAHDSRLKLWAPERAPHPTAVPIPCAAPGLRSSQHITSV